MKLNAEQKLIGRRNFLKAAAVLPAAGAVSYKALAQGPVKAGIVGTGMEGRILISLSDPKYVCIVASCDIRPDNRILGQKLIQNPDLGHHPHPKLYTNYEDMLNDPEIEAVIIATPIHLHGSMAIRALQAGKHVFVEKTMAYTLDECSEMIRVAKQKNLNLQVGHQRFYNPLYWDAYKMLNEGLLGSVYHIRALWHRNTDWNYWTHTRNEADEELLDQLAKMDPQSFGYPDLQKLVNWRWYRETSHGLWTELCSHQLAIANWFFDATPTTVFASGGVYKTAKDQEDLYMQKMDEYKIKKKYNDTPANSFSEYVRLLQGYEKDDRTIPDHIYAIFEYPNHRTVTYSCIQSSSVDNYYEKIMGTRGTIVLSNENESYLFWEPGWDEDIAQQVVKEMKETQLDVVKEDAGKAAFAAHESQEAAGRGGASDMDKLDPYRWEMQGFAHTIRTGAPNLCDGVAGAKAALACLYGKQSLENRQKIEIPPLNV